MLVTRSQFAAKILTNELLAIILVHDIFVKPVNLENLAFCCDWQGVNCCYL